MKSIYKQNDPPDSYTVKIPVGNTNYLQIIESLTSIFGNPIKSGWYISNSRDDVMNWVILIRGQPDKKFTRLCLEYPCKLVERVERKDDLYCKF